MSLTNFPSLEPTLQELLPSITEFRHELHRWPELGYEEEQTAGKVQEKLESLGGLDIRSGLARTGLVATLNADSPGPCIAFRADMDCLPMEDTSGVPWASERPGLAHACGHDGHTACLLGTAEILARHRDQLRGPVKFIFQPAEEGGAGGRAMLEAGVLENPTPAFLFGLHGLPQHPVGTFGIRTGPVMAASDLIRIKIQGKGCHAAMPHLGKDPIVAAAQVISALQSLTSRNTDPLDNAVVTIARIRGGETFNVIPDTVELTGTIRTLREETRTRIHQDLKHLVEGVSGALGCPAEVVVEKGYPVCRNHPEATDFLEHTLRTRLVDHGKTVEQEPLMAAEDFAFYGAAVPSAFFFVGVREEEDTDPPLLHQGHYDFNDRSIPQAIRAFCSLALDFQSR